MPLQVEIAERGTPLGGRVSVWIHYRCLPFLASGLIRFFMYGLRVRREGFARVQALAASGDHLILAFWHRRLLMMPLAYPFRRRGIAILSSDSKDGERSAATWKWFGIHAVRGTATHSGARGLLKMIQAVRQGWDLGITVDGPKGPGQKVKPGVLAVSRKTGAWIVPVCIAFDRFSELRTWDAMVLPHPFAHCTIRYGEPYRQESLEDEESARIRLEDALNDMETWAKSLGET